MTVAGVLVTVLAEALRAIVVFVRNMNYCGLERRPNGLMCCKHSIGKRLRNHDCACTDLQLPSQQIDDVDNAATCLHYDMESPGELEARRRGLRGVWKRLPRVVLRCGRPHAPLGPTRGLAEQPSRE